MTDLDGRGYPSASTSQRRRSIIALAALGSVLLIAFLTAFSYIHGWFPSQSVAQPAAPTSKATEPAQPSGSPAPPSAPPSSPSCTPMTPKKVTVNVFNATKRPGLAGTAAKILKDQGFSVGKVSNDPSNKKVEESAEIRFGASGEAKADFLVSRVVGAVKVQDNRSDDTIDIALGEKFSSISPGPSSGGC
ncbi:LytR C-terminal domain-containing protein [Austwickia chelonae]|uniref:LytR C-terminal domain-containing protein n=1 Tax=Austwickia chelonae TaxID=100225 RepID=UPI000E226BB1|nr:LytR C-terminal domain-containing protein [Austwickia chelonae]